MRADYLPIPSMTDALTVPPWLLTAVSPCRSSLKSTPLSFSMLSTPATTTARKYHGQLS